MDQFDKRMEELRADFNRGMAAMDRRLSSLGERWGTEAEGSFRRAMEDVLRTRFGADVRKWRVHDDGCVVRPFPSDVEVDLLIRGERHLLMEVKSSATDSDVVDLWRSGQLYARETGVTPDLAMVTPAPVRPAREVASRLGVTLHTDVA